MKARARQAERRKNAGDGGRPPGSWAPTSFVDVVFLLLVFMTSGLRFTGSESKMDVFLPADR